jgi:hypothetical protein
MNVDWFNTCEEQPDRMRNLAKELRLALFPQVSARKFRNWSTEAQREVDSCLLLATHRVIALRRGNCVAFGRGKKQPDQET